MLLAAGQRPRNPTAQEIDEKLWGLFGTGRHEELKYWYWRLMRLKHIPCPYKPDVTAF